MSVRSALPSSGHNGQQVSSRGRIQADVVKAYQAAN
ncbi:Lsr2 family DNA-binding protein [Nocardia stercoris]|uniref:Lsr2 DNA-binding domain-containing protein n=1 Tax=Nocardia stercoris TaxID=2483361 RepID=A0A3M2L413_9NOCA|nr:Lsr2 family protein [Nocardia stercoris]RMI31450.1 hypothetical protein EBN03_19110 [Nocardia stercoris]